MACMSKGLKLNGGLYTSRLHAYSSPELQNHPVARLCLTSVAVSGFEAWAGQIIKPTLKCLWPCEISLALADALPKPCRNEQTCYYCDISRANTTAGVCHTGERAKNRKHPCAKLRGKQTRRGTDNGWAEKTYLSSSEKCGSKSSKNPYEFKSARKSKSVGNVRRRCIRASPSNVHTRVQTATRLLVAGHN